MLQPIKYLQRHFPPTPWWWREAAQGLSDAGSLRQETRGWGWRIKHLLAQISLSLPRLIPLTLDGPNPTSNFHLSAAPSSCPPPLLPHSTTCSAPSIPYRWNPLLTPSTPSSTRPGQSNRRAGSAWWARSEKPPGCLARTAQQDGYAGRLLFTIAGEAKWMSAGFHLTGNLRNVREVTVNELFWICLVMSFFPLSDQRCFFLLEECGGMTKMSVYVTVAYFGIYLFWRIIGWTFSCSSFTDIYCI